MKVKKAKSHAPISTKVAKRSKDFRESMREKYYAFVRRKAAGEEIDESKLMPILVWFGKGISSFDNDVARAIEKGKSAAKIKEADGMQPKIDRLAEQVATFDREREKLANEFRAKVEAIQEKRETLYDEYRSLRDIQQATRQDAQRALTK